MTIQRFLLALLLSIVITIALAAAYVFYPLVAMLIREMAPHDAETGGVAFAAGGIRSMTLFIMESVVFLIMLALLYRRRTNS